MEAVALHTFARPLLNMKEPISLKIAKKNQCYSKKFNRNFHKIFMLMFYMFFIYK